LRDIEPTSNEVCYELGFASQARVRGTPRKITGRFQHDKKFRQFHQLVMKKLSEVTHQLSPRRE